MKYHVISRVERLTVNPKSTQTSQQIQLLSSCFIGLGVLDGGYQQIIGIVNISWSLFHRRYHCNAFCDAIDRFQTKYHSPTQILKRNMCRFTLELKGCMCLCQQIYCYTNQNCYKYLQCLISPLFSLTLQRNNFSGAANKLKNNMVYLRHRIEKCVLIKMK